MQNHEMLLSRWPGVLSLMETICSRTRCFLWNRRYLSRLNHGLVFFLSHFAVEESQAEWKTALLTVWVHDAAFSKHFVICSPAELHQFVNFAGFCAVGGLPQCVYPESSYDSCLTQCRQSGDFLDTFSDFISKQSLATNTMIFFSWLYEVHLTHQHSVKPTTNH